MQQHCGGETGRAHSGILWQLRDDCLEHWLKGIKGAVESTMESHHQNKKQPQQLSKQLHATLPHLQQAPSSLQNHQNRSAYSSQNNVFLPTLRFWRIRPSLPPS